MDADPDGRDARPAPGVAWRRGGAVMATGRERFEGAQEDGPDGGPRGEGAERRPLEFVLEAPDSAVALALMGELVRELLTLYDDDWHGDVVPEGCIPPRGAFVVARQAGVPVACGGFRPFEGPVAELKRMYVTPAARGRGLAGALLGHLETLAAAAGYRSLRLEAGTKQPEALRLYERAGYRRVSPGWGIWADDPLSVFLEKPLAGALGPDASME
jgi:GNAT superfamily N-acetyltransferase